MVDWTAPDCSLGYLVNYYLYDVFQSFYNPTMYYRGWNFQHFKTLLRRYSRLLFFFFRTRYFCMLRSVNYIKIYLGDKLRYTLLYNLRTVKNICSSLKNTIHETKKGILDSKATTDWKGNTNCKLKVWNFQNNIAQFLSYASCRFFSSIPHKRSTYVFHFAANNFTVKSRGS